MSFCIERASSNMHAEPVPQRAILVGMILNSFAKWYANLYFHIPPLVLLGSRNSPASNRNSCFERALKPI